MTCEISLIHELNHEAQLPTNLMLNTKIKKNQSKKHVKVKR